MDPIRLRSCLRVTRNVVVYLLIISVIGVTVTSFNKSLLPVAMNIMMVLVYILIGVVSAESIVASLVKKKGRIRVTKEGQLVKRTSTTVDFMRGYDVYGMDVGDLGKYIDIIMDSVKSYPKAISLAGLAELLVDTVGKSHAVKMLERDVDRDALKESYKSFINAIDREEIENFKYEVENWIMNEKNPVAVIMGIIELVAREFGIDKKDIVYAVLAQYVKSL